MGTKTEQISSIFKQEEFTNFHKIHPRWLCIDEFNRVDIEVKDDERDTLEKKLVQSLRLYFFTLLAISSSEKSESSLVKDKDSVTNFLSWFNSCKKLSKSSKFKLRLSAVLNSA
ncbi:hypothetical protein BpHYR1_054195 [Brachionus plicatilis]|uniref:Uncharacterized protein n=1 Tax=Brachionus plicatilis TaxID=10195 RepID=A0A3M7Q541_BRAPC|nr:hypothetical protein BpHYR1_054195 [Brachionus plicatilis]